jgi:alkylhydroperoxidase family enzyme
VKSHAAVAAVLLARERGQGADEFDGETFVEGVLRDPESSSLNEKEKALLRFVDKVNHDSPQITAQDMQPLYAVGWDDEVIYYAITVCALFNFYNRWIDASGVHALSAKAHREGGKRSANTGYVRK